MSVFRFLHLSDLHIAGEANRYSLIDSYHPIATTFKSFANFQSPLKIPSHDARAARALANQLSQEKGQYDAILISGDLATTGLDEDIQAAYNYLHGKLRQTKEIIEEIHPICDVAKLIWMPGNHDRYHDHLCNPGCRRFEKENYFGEKWRKSDQLLTDLGTKNGPVHSYHMAKDDRVLTIICVDFSFQKSDFPKHIGRGIVLEDVLIELEKVTLKSKEKYKETAIIWVSHFPPKFPRVADSLMLENEENLLKLAEKLDISIILSGHTHEAIEYDVPMESKNIRVICCGTSLEHQANNPKLSLQIIEIDISNFRQVELKFIRLFWRKEKGNINENITLKIEKGKIKYGFKPWEIATIAVKN